MTNKEFLIDELSKVCLQDKETVETIFNIVYEKDYEVFCSQMGDYDHPEERERAYKTMNKKLSDFIGISVEKSEVVKRVIQCLENEEFLACTFYCEHFHSLYDEYVK